jgi:uncharacterized protein YjcR
VATLPGLKQKINIGKIMTQKQIHALFGVSPSTLKEWKADPENKKHNLGMYLASLDYETAKKDVDKVRKKLDIIAE